MALRVFHKYSTVAGTPPAAGDIDVGELAINAADAAVYTKDTNGSVKNIAIDALFAQAGTGAVQRTVESKLKDVVSVKDFGAVGDGVADDTAAIQAAISSSATQIIVPTATYKLTGEVVIGSNTSLYVQDGTIFNLDASGENGRGFYFKEAVNSGITGNFTINASATSLGADGSKNSCIQFGNDAGDASPSITANCFCQGNIAINISGAQNVKGVYLAGWVEDTVIEGVSVTGQTNYAITAHWTKDTAAGVLPTKTWHAHNIEVRRCKVYQKAGYSKPLRGFTFSAAGKVTVKDCTAQTDTLSFNPFVGDYGYTYAQNITSAQAFDFTFENITHLGGDVALSADCASGGLEGSPVWLGTDYNATLAVSGFSVDGNDSADGLLIAATSVDTIIFDKVLLRSSNTGHTREYFYPQLCNTVRVENSSFEHHRYMRLRTTPSVQVQNCKFSKAVSTPDATSYVVTLDGVSDAVISTCYISGSRIGIYSVDNNPKKIAVLGCTFRDIGLYSTQISYCDQLLVNGNTFRGTGTTTTTVNIYTIFGTDVTGFVVSNNLFKDTNARYIVYIDATTANGVITGNVFNDINTGATNPAAVFKNASATNILIDTASNIVGSGVTLVYP